MLLKNKLNQIKHILKRNNVLSKKEERYCYSQDAANMRENSKSPDLVVYVESIEDIQKIVKYANIHEIPIVPRGAGTNMVGSCICSKGGIVLNFSKMNKILDFNPDNMTMTVQPGVVVGDIKKLAESKNLFYPPDPSNFRVSTIGGSIAQSSGGACAFKYGTTKDYILSLKVVMADGTLVQLGANTVKDAVGYHLNQLIVGSEGTLGIVAEATLKLIPKPQTNSVITAYFNNYQDAAGCISNILKSNIFPSAVDFMDNNSIRAVEKYKNFGLDTNYECMLIIELDGDSASVEAQTKSAAEIINNSNAGYANIITQKEGKEAVWNARRSSFAAAAQLGPDVVSDDIIVPREKLSEMIQNCHNICQKYSLTACIVGHVGDGNIHPQIVLNLENDDEYKNYLSAKSEIYGMVLELGGTISSEHGVGTEKRDYISKAVDSNALEYMKRIKMLFDPKNILNPDKIFKL